MIRRSSRDCINDTITESEKIARLVTKFEVLNDKDFKYESKMRRRSRYLFDFDQQECLAVLLRKKKMSIGALFENDVDLSHLSGFNGQSYSHKNRDNTKIKCSDHQDNDQGRDICNMCNKLESDDILDKINELNSKDSNSTSYDSCNVLNDLNELNEREHVKSIL